ncbi:MAG: hypothetical protein Q4B26_00415 [Eubacteriales bacterium]|nr:hypothetical protein [Eubacteriales bacterium]
MKTKLKLLVARNTAALGTLMMSVMLFVNSVYATEGADLDGLVSSGFDAVFRVERIITGIVGLLLFMVGLIRFVLAHANEDGPNQQKAAMMIAAGIGVIVVGQLVPTLFNLTTFINTGA